MWIKTFYLLTLIPVVLNECGMPSIYPWQNERWVGLGCQFGWSSLKCNWVNLPKAKFAKIYQTAIKYLSVWEISPSPKPLTSPCSSIAMEKRELRQSSIFHELMYKDIKTCIWRRLIFNIINLLKVLPGLAFHISNENTINKTHFYKKNVLGYNK